MTRRRRNWSTIDEHNGTVIVPPVARPEPDPPPFALPAKEPKPLPSTLFMPPWPALDLSCFARWRMVGTGGDRPRDMRERA
jgi:hypothetical protein